MDAFGIGVLVVLIVVLAVVFWRIHANEMKRRATMETLAQRFHGEVNVDGAELRLPVDGHCLDYKRVQETSESPTLYTLEMAWPNHGLRFVVMPRDVAESWLFRLLPLDMDVSRDLRATENKHQLDDQFTVFTTDVEAVRQLFVAPARSSLCDMLDAFGADEMRVSLEDNVLRVEANTSKAEPFVTTSRDFVRNLLAPTEGTSEA